MWPLTDTLSFGEIPCPKGDECDLLSCFFLHNAAPKAPAQASPKPTKPITSNPFLPASSTSSQPSVFTGSLAPSKGVNPFKLPSETPPRTATRAISPPPKKTEAEAKPEPKPDPPVSLTPRKLSKEPAGFTKRMALLKLLRQYMAALNNKVQNGKTKLTDNQLNKLAVDEEEQTAVQNKTVYENVLKQRLVTLKKMDVSTWTKEREDAIAKEKGDLPAEEKPKPVESGLTPEQEVQFLSRLTADPVDLCLDKHGYVIQKPTDAEIEETEEALKLADFYEVCERCKTRFQAFPDRRLEDGALTTQGKCTHHWGRKEFPKRQDAKYTCCHEPIGSPGCVVGDTHVFKVSEAKRLSAIMPFIETPENEDVSLNTAVCFDCEMSYTTRGLELIRLTALAWPSHKPVLDVLVRPLGHVLDLNTRFSGVTRAQFLNAKPHDPANPVFDSNDLRIVGTPHRARALFCQLISPKTPVLGHAIDNDLNTIRLIHPTIIDTVLLYPHPAGLPIRNGLRSLAQRYLGLKIQQAGADGHDSHEDARATGELVRLKVAKEWRKLRTDGWQWHEGTPIPPPPVGPPPTDPVPGEKRKRDDLDDVEDGEDDRPVAKKEEGEGGCRILIDE
ncbi:hypothetical protein K491DRAFT_699005 [Lophiostoma macrostomum CBS 122681]|uniref:Exonuclease domain-containing protein n=1 Tax=Lophiostoma macrostomum CBS 122681 TaxID=1314788 RepID=A0A6A6SMT7_9PLEO|nr:hypothetical protein K491DRAFT_699005 [Lophiostoma macrostomum CBS 122681]